MKAKEPKPASKRPEIVVTVWLAADTVDRLRNMSNMTGLKQKRIIQDALSEKLAKMDSKQAA